MTSDFIMNPRPVKSDQKRLPKKARAKKPPAFRVTDRDIELLKSACKHRYLTVDQIAWLFPDSSKRGLENRLRYLYHNRYLNRVILHESVSHKLIYAMTEKAARLIAERDSVARQEIPWQRHLNQISMSHIMHLLEVNSAVISLESALAVAKENRKVNNFRVLLGVPETHKLTVTLVDQNGSRYNSSVVPDAVVGILFPNREIGMFFIEVDRATMTVARWQSKTVVYREYSRSPELEERFKTNWFIVLTITTSEKRVMSLAQSSVAVGGNRAFWYTIADRITPESILSPIWSRAGDLFQIRNERISQLADYKNCQRLSILDTVGA